MWMIEGKTVKEVVRELAKTRSSFAELNSYLDLFAAQNKLHLLEKALERENINTVEKLIERYSKYTF